MSLTQTIVTNIPFLSGDPDVQRTSFSLDIMGRFICNTYSEATINADFDVIVIGSGMYGAYCAAKIYRDSRAAGGKQLRILILEAGPFLVHEHGQNIPDLGLKNPFRPVLDPFSPQAQQPRDLVWGVGWRSNVGFPGTAYCVGGKSIYWGGWCPRLRSADLEQWPDDVRKYLMEPPMFPSAFPSNRLSSPEQNSVYEEVEFEIGVKPPDDYIFDPLDGPNESPNAIGLNAALKTRIKAALSTLRTGTDGIPLDDPEPPPIAVQTQSFVSGVFSPDKYSSLTLLISALRDARGSADSEAGLFLVPNAHVSRLVVPSIFKDGADRKGYGVTGVDLFIEGQRKLLSVKPTCTVVLALSCIESTRLALESFPTAPGEREKELMGRNLMAHLRFDFPFSVDRQGFRNWVEANTGKKLREELQTASFHLQANTPDGRFHLQVYATGDSSGNAEGLLYRMIPDAEVARRLAKAQDPNKINLIFRACGEITADRNTPVGKDQTSWIDLASAQDRDTAFDHARAYVHYADQNSSPMWKRMRDACMALSKEMGAVGEPPPEDRHEVGSTWHDAGTLFMGSDPQHSVTDIHGHFHHITNSACVDQALFPTVGSANPVLTGLCLSRKVAETIVSRFITEPELTGADIEREKNEGFEFLLAGGNASKWKPNAPRFISNRSALIVNGTILEVHGDAGLGVLFYDEPQLFKNFELRVQWKAFMDPSTGDISANSGIFLRAPQPPGDLTDANFYDHTIEIQIDDTGYDFAGGRFRSPLHRTGAIYKIAPARVRTQKTLSMDGTPGFWNSYHITASGTKIRVELNNVLVSEASVPPALMGAGRIAVQYHAGKVQFRSIRIKRL